MYEIKIFQVKIVTLVKHNSIMCILSLMFFQDNYHQILFYFINFFYFLMNMSVSHMRHCIYFISLGLFLLNVCDVSMSNRLRGYV